jgi:transposase
MKNSYITNLKFIVSEVEAPFYSSIDLYSRLTNKCSTAYFKFIKKNESKIKQKGLESKGNINIDPESRAFKEEPYLIAPNGEKLFPEFSKQDTEKKRPKIKNTVLTAKVCGKIFRKENIVNSNFKYQLLENAANRYTGYISRNDGRWPCAPIILKKKSFNFGRCGFLKIFWNKDIHGAHNIVIKDKDNGRTNGKLNKSEMSVRVSLENCADLAERVEAFKKETGVKIDKKTGADTTKFQANYSKKTNSFVATVKVYEREPMYQPVDFLGIDINKDKRYWVSVSQPIFNGSHYLEMPDDIQNTIKRITEIQDRITTSLGVAPNKRRIKGAVSVKIKKNGKGTEKPISYTSDGTVQKQRRRLRLVWKKLHKKLGSQIFNLGGINLLKNHLIENKLGLALDMVKTGASSGTYGAEDIQGFFNMLMRTMGVPVKSVGAAYTSQRCSGCGFTHKKNRNMQKQEPQVECLRCGEVSESGINSAENMKQAGAYMWKNNLKYVSKRDNDCGFIEQHGFQDKKNEKILDRDQLLDL